MSDFLWVEKYRPRKVADTILPDGLKSTFRDMVSKDQFPNMLFAGSAGVGKTTIAKALCDETGVDYIIINGSEEGNIDTLRGKIKHFASTVSLSIFIVVSLSKSPFHKLLMSNYLTHKIVLLDDILDSIIFYFNM